MISYHTDMKSVIDSCKIANQKGLSEGEELRHNLIYRLSKPPHMSFVVIMKNDLSHETFEDLI